MKNILFFCGLVLASLLFGAKSYAYTLCANNGSTAASAITETGDCYTQPDTQKVIFYKIALCRGQPTAPTTTTAIGTSSCTNVFYNASGSTTTIVNGSLTGLTGNTALDDGRLSLPTGTYSYVYMEVDPSFQQQKVAYFATARNNSDSTSNGVKCWSLPVTVYGKSAGSPTATTCGATGAATTGLGLTTVVNNTLNGAAGFVYSMDFSCNSPANTISAYLLTSTGLLASTASNGSLGNIAKIGGFTQVSNGFTITRANQKNISSLAFGFLNSGGTSVSQGGGVMSVFSGGPFCTYLKSYSM
jgi:hypothetical protein